MPMTAETNPGPPPALQATEAAPGQVSARPFWWRPALLALAVGALLAVVYLSPLRAYTGDLHDLSGRIRSLGLLGPIVLSLSVALLVAVGLPRLLFCVIAGMALGFWSGLFWAQVGTLLGNYVLFCVAGTSGRCWAERYLTKRPRLYSLIREEGTWGVILARQIPVPGPVVNMVCGLLGVRHRHFLLGTAIGQLPEAIPCTLIGAGAIQSSSGKSAGLISLAVAVSILVWVAMRRWLSRQRLSESTSQTADCR